MTRQCTTSGVDANGAWACDRKAAYSTGPLCRAHIEQERKGNGLKRLRPQRRRKRGVERHDPNDMFCRIPHGHQRCTDCAKVKPLDQYAKSPKGIDGVTGICRDCQHDRAVDRAYGEGAAEWKAKKLAEQGYKCACCGTDNPTKKGWNLDHCHKTGEWRAVLCLICNMEIGYLEKWADDPVLREYAAKALGITVGRLPPDSDLLR